MIRLFYLFVLLFLLSCVTLESVCASPTNDDDYISDNSVPGDFADNEQEEFGNPGTGRRLLSKNDPNSSTADHAAKRLLHDSKVVNSANVAASNLKKSAEIARKRSRAEQQAHVAKVSKEHPPKTIADPFMKDVFKNDYEPVKNEVGFKSNPFVGNIQDDDNHHHQTDELIHAHIFAKEASGMVEPTATSSTASPSSPTPTASSPASPASNPNYSTSGPVNEADFINLGRKWYVEQLITQKDMYVRQALSAKDIHITDNFYMRLTNPGGGKLHWSDDLRHHWIGYDSAIAPWWLMFNSHSDFGFAFRNYIDGNIMTIHGSGGGNKETGGRRVEINGNLILHQSRIHFDNSLSNHWIGYDAIGPKNYMTFSSHSDAGFTFRNSQDGDLLSIHGSTGDNVKNGGKRVSVHAKLFLSPSSRPPQGQICFSNSKTQHWIGYDAAVPNWMNFVGHSDQGFVFRNEVDGDIVSIRGSTGNNKNTGGKGMIVNGSGRFSGNVSVDGDLYVRRKSLSETLTALEEEGNDLTNRLLQMESTASELMKTMKTLMQK